MSARSSPSNQPKNAVDHADGEGRADGTTAAPSEAAPEKIKVHLVAAGSAPLLKRSKFLMNADDPFAVAVAFVRKLLQPSPGAGDAPASSLFLYVNAAFVPAPDARLGDLHACFGTRGELVVHYSLQEAWG